MSKNDVSTARIKHNYAFDRFSKCDQDEKRKRKEIKEKVKQFWQIQNGQIVGLTDFL
ncbi:hypothetical protein GF322_04925 [Candidatus Dependentiae bacterium]|nr:hypothetical protein [Candidatus Dependentiae bacterium]